MRPIFDLTSRFHDGGHDAISHRKVLPSAEYTQTSVWCIQCIYSSVSQFLIHSTLCLYLYFL